MAWHCREDVAGRGHQGSLSLDRGARWMGTFRCLAAFTKPARDEPWLKTPGRPVPRWPGASHAGRGRVGRLGRPLVPGRRATEARPIPGAGGTSRPCRRRTPGRSENVVRDDRRGTRDPAGDDIIQGTGRASGIVALRPGPAAPIYAAGRQPARVGAAEQTGPRSSRSALYTPAVLRGLLL